MAAPDETAEAVSSPIDAWLQTNGLGSVVSLQELPTFEFELELKLVSRRAYEALIEYLDKSGVPLGTTLCRAGWFRMRTDCRVFIGEPVDE